MFYQMITCTRDRWLKSSECTISGIIDYIITTGQMRDAQIDAIKTYLFLKIACGCKPLAELFCQGAFNNLDLEQVELSKTTYDYLVIYSFCIIKYIYYCI